MTVPQPLPKRIQRKRTKGYRLPPDAVYVGRPTLWGNPFTVRPVRRSGPFDVLLNGEFRGQHTDLEVARRSAVDLYREALRIFEPDEDFWTPLTGRDLACWCPLDQPCHADVLLEIANA